MKYLSTVSSLIVTILFLAVFYPAFSGDNLLNSFQGGMHDMNLFGSSTLATGIGAYESAAGIGITTLRPSAAAIHWNPAGLAFLKRGGIILEAVPELSYSPDVSSDVNAEVDNALEKMEQDNETILIYPDFTMTAGQKGRAISALAVAFPYRDMYFGASYQRVFSLGINLISAGLENKITSLEEDPNQNAIIFTRTDINMLLDFEVDAVSLGMGRMFTPKLGLGLALSHYNCNVSLNGVLAPEGVFTRSGIENSFNDPSEVWQNDFYSAMSGTFEGGSWGMKAGLGYQVNDDFCLNFLLNYTGNMTLEGSMEIIQYTYSALNLNADEDAGEEMFDLDNLEEVTQPTQTKLIENEPSSELLINAPSSISIGAGYKWASLTLTNYMGELSYSYDLARNGIPATYSRGLDLKYGFLLGFDLKYVRLGIGAIAADEIVEGYMDDEGEPLKPTTGVYIPRFSLGTGFNITPDWKCDILLVGMPDILGSVMKVSATYAL